MGLRLVALLAAGAPLSLCQQNLTAKNAHNNEAYCIEWISFKQGLAVTIMLYCSIEHIFVFTLCKKTKRNVAHQWENYFSFLSAYILWILLHTYNGPFLS